MIYLLFGQVDLRGPVWWFQNPEMSSARKFASAPHNHLSSSPNLSAAGGSREICVNLWRTSWRSCCRTRRRRRRTLTQFLRVVVSVTLSELSSFDFWAKKRNFRLAKILWGASKSTWALLNLPFQPTLNATDEESQSSTSLNWLCLRNKIHKFYLSSINSSFQMVKSILFQAIGMHFECMGNERRSYHFWSNTKPSQGIYCHLAKLPRSGVASQYLVELLVK